MKCRYASLILVLVLLPLIFSYSLVHVYASFTIETDKDSYYPGETITITVSGATPNGKVMFQLNDPEGNPVWAWEEPADANGRITLQLTIPSTWKTGTYTLLAKDVSTGSTASKTFSVVPYVPPPPVVSRIVLTSNLIEAYTGETVVFTATVYDQYDNVMAGVEVNLYINDVFYGSDVTNAEGKAMFTVTFTEAGTYSVYAVANNVTSNIVTITVRVRLVVTSVTLTADKTEIMADESVTFTAEVRDQYNNPMSNVWVSLYVADRFYDRKMTGTDGKAVFVVRFTEAGSFDVYAIADNVKSNIIKITVKAPPPPPRVALVDLTADKTEVTEGGSITFTATVYDQYGKPMSDVGVKLYVNDKLYLAKVTDANGKAVFDVVFTKAGSYNVYAMADTVKSPTITITVKPKPVPPVPPIPITYMVIAGLIIVIIIVIILVAIRRRV